LNKGRIVIGAGLLVAVLFASALSARAAGALARWSITPAWSVQVPGVLMVADAPRRAGGPAHILAQGADRVVAIDAAGTVLASTSLPGALRSAATGDVDGDGADDLILAQGGAATSVSVFDGMLKPLWSVPAVAGLTQPTRVLAVDLDGDRRREVVVGDARGRVSALNSSGRVLWSFQFADAAENAEIRGLDDIALGQGRGRLVAVARRAGEIVLLDGVGKMVGSFRARKPVRRLRAFDLDGDGRDEAVFGDEAGAYQVMSADGTASPLGALGDTVTEIRTLEADGDASLREIVVGGKRGEFVLLSGRTVKARGTVPGKISAAGGVDVDGDGRQELFVGTEGGSVYMFDGNAERLAELTPLGNVERILGVASKARQQLLVVGAGAAVAAFRVERMHAPAWYSPWVPALLGLMAIGIGALALALSPSPVAPPVAVVDPKTQEVELAIARINDLMARGVVAPELGAERLKQLERQRGRAQGAAAAPRTRKAPGNVPPPPPRRKP
jgi:hypothetical protein